ncbi:hypothetical protein COLO4_08180 [Corchorus olitorius]|uniref:Uncharacterized protein n=1 Tax=Corchorus olitorius TaxID=93759 RepID=A0A1R3KGW5_9ROSI|nr:hypothetical protein COLO4_08180 [Corchorus olitorius]
MVLRGRQVGKPIVSDDSSCEILSHNPRSVAQPTGEGGISVMQGPRISGGFVGVVARSGEEGSRFEAEIRELYGDLGLPDSMGRDNQLHHLRESVATIKGKAKQVVAENQGWSSTESSTPFNFGFEGGSQQQNLRGGVNNGQPISHSVSSPSIPGLDGPSNGVLRIGRGPDLMGLVNGLVTSSPL